MQEFRILNLGAGVQSTTLYLRDLTMLVIWLAAAFLGGMNYGASRIRRILQPGLDSCIADTADATAKLAEVQATQRGAEARLAEVQATQRVIEQKLQERRSGKL